MKKHLLHSAVLLALAILMHLVWLPTAHAAPGDFLFFWGAQQHFSAPLGVAVDQNGNVFVTDTDCVQVFNSSGTRINKWGTYGSGDRQFSYPRGIAVDKSGRVYVVDTGNNRIQVLDSAGNFLFNWSHNWWGSTIDDIAIDGSGNVYVADTGSFDGTLHDYVHDSIKLFDSQGNFIRNVGSHGTGDGQFRGPNGVAIHTNGNVYVGDNWTKVQEFSSSGAFIRTVMVDPMAGFHGLALDRSGNIYLAGTMDFWSGEIGIFDNAGNYIRSFKFFDEYVWEHYWNPISVALDQGGNVFSVEYGNDGVRAFDSAGNLLGQWWTYGTGASQLTEPTGIAVGRNGNVYETDGADNSASVSADRLRFFDSEGTYLDMKKITTDSYSLTTSGVALDRNGNINVLTLEGFVFIFDGSGNFIRSWDSYYDDSTRLIQPSGIAVDRSGNFFISDTDDYSGTSRVAIFDSAGNFLKNLGTGGSSAGQFRNPKGIAIDESGNIYVVDAGNYRIQKFNSAHVFARQWGSQGAGDGQFSDPSGIAVDVNGNVFVADSGNNRVQAFNSTGNFLGKWGSAGDENGFFKGPRGVSVSSTGARVYVADTGNNRIQVFVGYPPPSYSVSGTVRQGSSTGPVLAGATVTIAGKTATTSSTGSFTITGVPSGTYTFTISKVGYSTKTSTVYNIQSNRSGLVFYLTPLTTYYVSGTVRQGSATGPALAGATVTIAGKTATTYSNGSFKITGIPKGTYTFTISKPGYVTKTSSAYLIQSNRSGLAFYLSAAATSTFTVTGTVRQGSATGPALAGATVQIAGKTATTYSNGSFSISGIPAGTYSFTISRTGYITKTTTVYLIQSNRSGLVFYLSPAPAASVSRVRRGVTAGPDPAVGMGKGAGRKTETYNSPLRPLI